MVLCLLAAGCKTVKHTVSVIELGNMDTTVNPAEDFYRYCNGNWLKNILFPKKTHTTMSSQRLATAQNCR